MNKSKFLTIAVMVLLAINLILIGFLISHKPGKQRKNNPRDFIIEKLELTQTQIDQYDVLIESHQPIFKEKMEKVHAKKNLLYMNLQSDSKESYPEALSNEIGALQREIETLQYNHFKDIKELCQTGQLANFDELMAEVSRLFSPIKPQKRRESKH